MSEGTYRVALQLPIIFCPTHGCGWQLTGQLFVDLATDTLVCLRCARAEAKRGGAARLAALKAEDAGFVPGSAPPLSEEDAVRLLLRLGATVLR